MQLAKIAYDAYKNQTGGVSLATGQKLPEFEQLPENIRDAWYASAAAVNEELKRIWFKDLNSKMK